ncbi:NADPH-dependent FMN reductase [Pelagivirga sediminicola]|uniref:NADPH-dependent FMN reductase n=1 Tax=Pelagivirga sediminicola TaxID=2170575 RepID=A0A2T7G812_9RHOB|nr:NADPH-dependent FMN reductase [Pelagivirga sediminicola]PVA10550.1 NADPH-dependent FMN reductase [Pelagivirga sediminicola]
MSTPVLLTMSGSLRKGSYNRMLIAEAVRAFGEAEVIEGDLDLPLFNGDVEDAGVPAKVQTLVDQVARADALIIGAPEYNKGISGVLKNAIDWLSRSKPPVLKDKIAVILSAAGGRTGGETGHFMTQSILTQLQVNVVHGPLILVAAAPKEFGEDGALNNDFLKGQVADRMARLRQML